MLAEYAKDMTASGKIKRTTELLEQCFSQINNACHKGDSSISIDTCSFNSEVIGHVRERLNENGFKTVGGRTLVISWY